MRAHVKLVMLGLFMVIGLSWVSEASAFIPSGGTRLLFYFSKRSFTPSAADNTGQTLLFVTNTNDTTATRLAIRHYQADCSAATTTTFQPIGAGQTLRIDVSSQTPASIQEGVTEMWAVDNSNNPIRWDRLAGSSVIIDFAIAQLVQLPAALLHSDNRTSPGAITNNASTTSFAPFLLTGNHFEPAIVTTRLALFAPGTAPGTIAVNRTIDVHFRSEAGTNAATTSAYDIGCGRSQTLAQVRGLSAAAFQAANPQGGIVAPQINGQEKGIVGWLIAIIQLPGVTDILFGQRLDGFGTASESAHP